MIFRYFPEFIECAKDFQNKTNPSCEEDVRSYVALLSLRKKNLCKSFILPSKYAQIHAVCIMIQNKYSQKIVRSIVDLRYNFLWKIFIIHKYQFAQVILNTSDHRIYELKRNYLDLGTSNFRQSCTIILHDVVSANCLLSMRILSYKNLWKETSKEKISLS